MLLSLNVIRLHVLHVCTTDYNPTLYRKNASCIVILYSLVQELEIANELQDPNFLRMLSGFKKGEAIPVDSEQSDDEEAENPSPAKRARKEKPILLKDVARDLVSTDSLCVVCISMNQDADLHGQHSFHANHWSLCNELSNLNCQPSMYICALKPLCKWVWSQRRTCSLSANYSVILTYWHLHMRMRCDCMDLGKLSVSLRLTGWELWACENLWLHSGQAVQSDSVELSIRLFSSPDISTKIPHFIV